MTTQRTGAAEPRPFDILGISEAEEQAYDWLLAHSGATVPEISRALALTPGKTQRLLDAIEAKGLATHTPERPRHYVPSSPDIALKALVAQRQESLQRAETAIQELQERAASRRQDEQEQIVEIITSREAERQAFEQIHRTAQHEVVTLIRLPLRVSRLEVPSKEDQRPQRSAQARGVKYRSIVDAECLSLPGVTHRILEDMKAGEDVRATPNLPFKMFIIDRRLALIPLKLQQPGGPSLVVRSSALLDALYALFEILWERSAPISFTAAGEPKTGEPGERLTEEAKELIALMAAGLNDKTIAHELHISVRTLRRHSVELMRSLNARTRFQAGWLAALQSSGRSAV